MLQAAAKQYVTPWNNTATALGLHKLNHNCSDPGTQPLKATRQTSITYHITRSQFDLQRTKVQYASHDDMDKRNW